MTDKNKPHVLKALRDYFSGKNSEKGEKIYTSWFHSFNDTKGYLDRLSPKERDEYKKRAFQSLQNKMDTSRPSIFNPIWTSRPDNHYLAYVLVAILVIGTIFSFSVIHFSDITQSEALSTVMIERSNPVGQISKITLPDGSTVWLGAASSLEYPEEFSEDDRTVQLNGQAFFDVEHDPSRPFSIESGSLFMHVLGTSFNVRAYHDDPDLEVTLVSGKVEVVVDGSRETRTLERNQRVKYDHVKGLSEIEYVDASLSKMWTQRELVFIRESFTTIAKAFERWYGVEFVFEDEELRAELFVFHFKDLSLANSLIVLNELARFDYEIADDVVYIRKAEE